MKCHTLSTSFITMISARDWVSVFLSVKASFFACHRLCICSSQQRHSRYPHINSSGLHYLLTADRAFYHLFESPGDTLPFWLRWHVPCALRDSSTNETDISVQLLTSYKQRKNVCLHRPTYIMVLLLGLKEWWWGCAEEADMWMSLPTSETITQVFFLCGIFSFSFIYMSKNTLKGALN